MTIREKTLTGFALILLAVFFSSASVTASRADVSAAAAGGGNLSAATVHSGIEETLLVEAIRSLENGRLDDATATLERLVARRPHFKLAQLVYADLLSARTRPLAQFGSTESAGDQLSALRDEALRRLRHYRQAPPSFLVPDNLILPSEDQPHVIVVDPLASRLYSFANVDGKFVRQFDYYVSSGKNGAYKLREGDQRTPVGVYFVTGRIKSSELPDFFGAGALPLNYPNEWDMQHGRTGYGIWIHGVPSNTYSRSPQASDGCIAMSNSDLEFLWRLLPKQETPVIIADDLRWVDPASIKVRRSEANAMLESWRKDWESLDFDRYARHYDEDFISDGKDRSAWLKSKRRINSAKTFIRVDLSNVSAFAYPGEKDVLVVTFNQKYRSSNYADQTKKRQYWRRHADGRWRILFETDARFRDVHYRGMPYSVRASLTRLNPPR